MNTITIKNLTLNGSHGAKSEEQKKSQPFSIDISVDYDFSRSIKTDDLADTIDYQVLEAIAQEVIEGSPRKLIERLAGEIAETILEKTEATSVEVSIAKPQALSRGVPSVALHRLKNIHQPGNLSATFGITPEAVQNLYDPRTDGVLHLKGVLYTILNEEKLRGWYQEKWQSFEKKDEKYIQNNQEVSVVYNGPFTERNALTNLQEIALHNLYHRIRKEIAAHSTVPLPPGDRLETKLIKYPISTLGVGAHKDLSSNINAIVLFNLYGTTTFYTASDKNRSDEKAYLVEPGDIVIMRGPRTKEENELRPIHYVLDILEERLVFVCREIEDATEAIINKGNWMGF